MVPAAGLEPALRYAEADFKSAVSTNSTTRAKTYESDGLIRAVAARTKTLTGVLECRIAAQFEGCMENSFSEFIDQVFISRANDDTGACFATPIKRV